MLLAIIILLNSLSVSEPMQTGRAIASALNVVQTSHSYGDFMLLAKAAESNQVADEFLLSPVKYVVLLVLAMAFSITKMFLHFFLIVISFVG